MNSGVDREAIQIRGFRSEDLGTLHHIDQICFPEGIAFSIKELFHLIRQRDALTMIADQGGTILGYLICQIKGDASAHIITLDVIPSARRSGIGSALLDSIHGALLTEKVRTVILEVSSGNKAARRLYEKNSYRYLEGLPNYYPGHGNAYRMYRQLTAAKP